MCFCLFASKENLHAVFFFFASFVILPGRTGLFGLAIAAGRAFQLRGRETLSCEKCASSARYSGSATKRLLL